MAVAPIKFFKVNAFPGTPLPNAFYYVNDGISGRAESWLTDDNAIPKQIGNTAMIEEVVSTIDGGTF